MKETILLVDDEKEIIKLMEIYMQNEGYRLLTASDGLEALERLRSDSVDLIILDVMMPRLDGIEACMRIREERDTPIIMLSAKSQDMDKIAGLSIGADDYVSKPFNPLELIARVKSQLRRYNRFARQVVPPNLNEITIDDLIINTAMHKVTVDQREVKLTPREFEVLHMLALNCGIVLSMDRIYEEVWKEPYMESKNTVMVHIRRLREKIERDPQHPRFIKTIWGIGYKMEPN
ncbi:DNA-binding response OmpR family regulator [Fontibacillus phaseoli]|uniref:DNA-binding response OmpR family regulator n=1 Tax=Fontibacillus phaseoli TaxID=1416533 RepID=A0A369AXA4_9BACL|nr:response regulator transcription factor [Fontibacillus phaseoli]RCX14030.1 DNA-binding response OmpR family regulator [Fontibacillus phaseoli]